MHAVALPRAPIDDATNVAPPSTSHATIITMVWALSDSQTAFEERVRTIGIAITALGVLAVFLFELRSALLHVLALFLKHFGARPAALRRRPRAADASASQIRSRAVHQMPTAASGCKRAAVPLPLAIAAAWCGVLSAHIAFTVLGLLGTIVAESVHVFAEHAEIYAHQLEHLLKALLGWVEWMTCGWTPHGCQMGRLQMRRIRRITAPTLPAPLLRSSFPRYHSNPWY